MRRLLYRALSGLGGHAFWRATRYVQCVETNSQNVGSNVDNDSLKNLRNHIGTRINKSDFAFYFTLRIENSSINFSVIEKLRQLTARASKVTWQHSAYILRCNVLHCHVNP